MAQDSQSFRQGAPVSVLDVLKTAILLPTDRSNVICDEKEIKECDHEQVKVIGAALCRTGTKSLREALGILGFRCYHMQDVVQLKHELLWIQVAKARKEGKAHLINWNKVLFDRRDGSKYLSIADNPGCLYFKELMQFYPKAKVILTQRDFEKWYASSYKTVWQTYLIAHLWQSRLMAPNTTKFLDDCVYYEGGLARFDDKEGAKIAYEAFTKDVIASVPKEQLLIFHVKQGWEPLCEFLGVPVPQCDFPHANKGDNFQTEVTVYRYVCKLMNVAILAGVSFVGYKLFKKYSPHFLP